MVRALLALAVLMPLAAGCVEVPRAPVRVVVETPPPVPNGWQERATADDQARIAGLPATWTRALAAVPRTLQAKRKAEGPLVDPAAALDVPALPPGSYHCRLIRFGGFAHYASFAPDFCYVESRDGALAFTKQTGSNLPAGWIYPDTDRRQVFLGTTRAPRDDKAPAYGSDPATDVAGVVERVAPFRWRLTLTRAGRGAILDTYELVPITPEVPGAPKTLPPPAG